MKKILSVLLGSILFLVAISLGVMFFSSENDTPLVNNESNSSDSENIFARATVAATGDNIISDTIYEQAADRSGIPGYDFSYTYENIADEISSADLALLNQESVISESHNVSGYPLFNSPAQLGNEMVKIGFDVVNVATNHILDYGEQGLINTLEFWKNAGIATVGASETSEDAEDVTITEVNGIKIAWVSFTESTNSHNLPVDSSASLTTAEMETYLLRMITKAREKADFIIAVAHWGNEYETEVSDSQRALAQKLASWGADVIIGSHPHVLQEMEYLEGENGKRVLVAYSLGNFLSSMAKSERLLGGLLKFDIVKNTATGAVTYENIKLTGVVTHYGYDISNIRIYPLSSYSESLASKHGIKEQAADFSYSYLKNLLSSTIDKQFLN